LPRAGQHETSRTNCRGDTVASKQVALNETQVVVSRSLTPWHDLLVARRLDDALLATDAGLAVNPAYLPLLGTKALTHLARGDFGAAQAVVREPSAGVDVD
jgi:hypothetical protein